MKFETIGPPFGFVHRGEAPLLQKKAGGTSSKEQRMFGSGEWGAMAERIVPVPIAAERRFCRGCFEIAAG